MSPACRAGELIYIHGAAEDAFARANLELAGRFYGIDVKDFQINSKADILLALAQIRRQEIVAVAATSSVLPDFTKHQVFAALRRSGEKSIPLLILSITPSTDTHQLMDWSDRRVSACQSFPHSVSRRAYVVGSIEDVTKQLSNIQLPNVFQAACYFVGGNSLAEPVLSVRTDELTRAIFIRTTISSNHVFFLSDTKPSEPSLAPVKLGLAGIFSKAAPMMLFVRYASGERGWHSPGHYANFTIDDAWLTQPYGHLDYQGLLAEMEKHNFHTTIAFIPWNFDRSEARLVSLIRNHSNRFSFSVHGDNHDHLEFGAYGRKPLTEQIANIKQALARMEKFQDSTALRFDPVMTFPYEVVPPLPTVRKLKEYGFAAAANADLVPLGSAQPSDPLFSLRTVTSDFANFALVRRYPTEIRDLKSMIAIHAFLDDPLLFYCHQDFFTNSIGAFDPIADTVNQFQPDTHWGGLGDIAQYLYLIKQRDDADYDVLAFSSDFILHNSLQRDVTFDVEKAEDNSTPIQTLTIDGRPSSYELSGGHLHIAVLVQRGGARHIVIRYQNDLNLASVDVSKKNPYVYALRRISDFRDMTLSRYSWGRMVTRLYYGDHLDDYELRFEKMLPLLLLLAMIIGTAGWIYRRKGRRKSLSSL